jgi:amino acid adenylation domain-containing protein
MRALLQHWVTEQAARRPDAPAVVFNDQRLTYAELEESTNRLARALKGVGCERGDRVCLLMPKTPLAIVGILGILKADCVYVPLDLASPPPRLAQMLAACEPRCVLATSAAVPVLTQLRAEEVFRASISIGWMEPDTAAGEPFAPAFSLADSRGYPATPPDYRNTAADAAYILFTSGSTGTPKGVVITHANVSHFVRWAVGHFRMTPSDRVSGHPPLHFDLSVFDIFGTFAAGAQLHLVPADLNLLPHKLAAFIRASELTQWFSVPSVLTYMAKFDVVRFNDFPALRRLLWCGEVLPTPVLIYWMKRLPAVTFTNLYGPTEATIASSYYTVPACPADAKAAIPIGIPCEGEELLVLDEALRPVRPGEIGEIYIRGVGVSPGYWRDPERTRAVFLPNPLSADPADRIYKTGDLGKLGDDGLVYFLGRADSQVKSRGYRIELGEIETWLHALPCLRESAVVAVDTDGFEGATICCAYAPAPGAEVTPSVLRTELAKVLPSYMLPARWLALDPLPKNANGKIDRRRLKEEFVRHAAHAS